MDVSVSFALRSCVDWIRRPPETSHVRRNVSPTWLTWMPNGVFTLIVWRYYWPPLFSRSWRYIDSGCGGGKRRGGGIVWRVCKILYTPCSTRLMSVTLLIFNEFSKINFAVRFSRKIAATYLSKTPPHPKWVATLPNARYITRYSSYIYKLW